MIVIQEPVINTLISPNRAGNNMSVYKQAVKREMIAKLRTHIKDWRNGDISAEDAMYDLEGWADEIWGDEE